jgi:hypothetical protein
MIPIIIRLMLTAFLLFQSYQETGPWTTVILFLFFLRAEIGARWGEVKNMEGV